MRRVIATLLTALVATSFAQFKDYVAPISINETEEVQQNRTISSPKNYNTLRTSGMKVGHLEEIDAPFTFIMGLRSEKLVDESDSTGKKGMTFSVPTFIVGTPNKAALAVYYRVSPLTEIIQKDLRTLSLPLHQFGFSFADQNIEKTFRFGINLDGYAGSSDYEETSDSGRYTIGADEVGLSFGSKPTPIFGFDIGVYAKGGIDTLFGTHKYNVSGTQKQIVQERMAIINVPIIKMAMNLGDSTFPVLSSFGYTYGKEHFVYATKSPSSSVNNRDAIIKDSTGWYLNTLGQIPVVDGKLTINPSVDFGFWHNRHKLMTAGEKNHPYKYDGENTGWKWETKSFRYGFGLNFSIFEFTDYWTEFGFSKIDIMYKGSNYNNKPDTSDDFSRFATGLEFAIHKIPGISYSESGKLYFSLSFQSLYESTINNTYYGSDRYKHLNDLTTNTQLWRYANNAAYNGLSNRVKTTDFTLGLRGSFMDNTFETIGRVHFVNQSFSDTTMVDLSVPRFQFDFVYNMVSPKK